MKRIVLCLGILLSAFQLSGDVNFSGELKPEVIFNIPGKDGYETLLNPGNMMEIGDVMFRNEINLKLDESSESGTLDLWIQLSQYPMADVLTGTAFIISLDPVIAADVASLAYASGAYLYTADILRANASWIPSSSTRITMGRQSYLTGYGYGWNPMDLANPPKDPTDPQAYLRGVDGLTFQWNPAPFLGVKAYGLLPSEGSSWDYDQLLAGGELTFQFTALEFKLSALYGGLENEADLQDLYPHAGAAGFFMDVLGLGLYGEGVVRSRSRRNDPLPAGGSDLREGPVYSALAGMEYYFMSGLVGAAEYFYNGEGWNQTQRSDYASALEGSGIGFDTLALYTPQYYARHYILLNLMIPWYEKDSSFNINGIYSPDSGAFFLTPTASFNLNYEGTLVSEIWYSGQFSFDDAKQNEAWLSPVNHSFMVNLRYYY